MQGLRQIQLATEETMLDDLQSIRKSYEQLYDIRIHVSTQNVPTANLCPTEPFLEEDKLALIFKKTIEEDYGPAVIVVKSGPVFYVLDGHHRAYIRLKLADPLMKAHLLLFPEHRPFRERERRRLGDMTTIRVSPIDDPILATWNETLKLLQYYEKLYGIPFTLREAYVPLRQLIPTQPMVNSSSVLGVRTVEVPITCLEVDGHYPILDGHARALAAKRDGLSSINAIVLVPRRPVHFRITTTAERMGLKTLEDLRILDDI
jgi:IMP dehydrogenase